jgi:hypothetical protein
MTFFKIGNRYVNFDLVRYIDDDEADGIRVVFSGKDGGAESVHFTGEQAKALQQWLLRNSTRLKMPAGAGYDS